ncbi:hypothetical protein [Methanosarcina acetivorans]|nr:hypothetical protein [Methanosarcina acetivorans]
MQTYCLLWGYMMTAHLRESIFTAIGVKHFTRALKTPAEDV